MRVASARGLGERAGLGVPTTRVSSPGPDTPDIDMDHPCLAANRPPGRGRHALRADTSWPASSPSASRARPGVLRPATMPQMRQACHTRRPRLALRPRCSAPREPQASMISAILSPPPITAGWHDRCWMTLANAGWHQQRPAERGSRHMGTVFPTSSGEQCPRDDCGSRQVERLAGRADFASLNLDSPARTLWLCLACQRPFKLVKCADAQAAPATARVRPAPVARLSGSVGVAAHVAERRMP